MQNENIASAIWNREESKTKTMQAQHEIVHEIKRVQHEKKCNMKILLHKKVQHGNGATWKECNNKKYKFPQWITERVQKNSAL